MTRGRVYSLAGLLLAIGIFMGCGAPEQPLDTPDVQLGQAQGKQPAPSDIYTAGDSSLADPCQAPLASEEGGSDSEDIVGASGAWADGTWVYNSDDHDAKAKFFSYGEHVKLYKLNNAHVYVKTKAYNSAGSVVEERRGDYDGAIDSCRDFNYAFGEGLDVYIKVCEEKGGIVPDDCSAWDYQGKS